MAVKRRQTTGVKTVARYRMTVVFDVHEEVEMKYVYREETDNAKADDVLKRIESSGDGKRRPHINKLFEDVLERIETSPKHPITYDILSFDEVKAE
jgi:hypothetical protein